MTSPKSTNNWRVTLLTIAKAVYRPIMFAAFIAVLAIYFMNNQSDLAALQNVSLLSIAVIVGLQLLVLSVNSWIFKVLCSVYQKKISAYESFAVTAKSSMVNFFGFMQGGTGYKAVYLKHRHGLAYKKFLVLQTANYAIIFIVSSALALLGLAARLYAGLPLNYLVVALFASILVASTAVLLIKKQLAISGSNKITRAINTALEGWHTLVNNKPVIVKLFAAALLQSLFLCCLFFAELQAIGVTSEISGVLIYAGLVNVSLVVAITPAAIGIREAIMLFSQVSLGVGASAILLSSAVDRIVYFFLLAILAAMLYKPLQKLVAQYLPKQ